MIDHIKVTQQKKLDHCNNFLWNVKSLGFRVNKYFWLVSKIQAKQQQKKRIRVQFNKNHLILSYIALCFDSKLKF